MVAMIGSSNFVGLYGHLSKADPITVCTGLRNNVNGTVVLVERYGNDTSCPYEKQAFEVFCLQTQVVIL